jgi:hypothetical protein
MKSYKIFLFALIIFLSCDDENESPGTTTPVTIFTLTVEADYPLKKDTWVMVHDKNGVLLDHKQINATGIATFQTSKAVPDDKIGVTFFTYDTPENINDYGFTSYLAVPTGQEWVWKKPSILVTQPGAYIGKFSATYTLPTPLRMDLFGNSTTLGGMNPSGNPKNYQADIFEKNRNFLLTIASDGNPRYKFFENVKNGDFFEITFENMLEYDKILNISFPAAKDPFVRVSTRDDIGEEWYYTYYNGFNLPPFAGSSTISNLKIGYLNRFEKYNTYILIYLPDFTFSYEKSGSAPDAVNVPDRAHYQVVDKTLENFSYSSEAPFTWRVSRFSDRSTPDKQVWWVLNAPEGTDRILELPQPFLELYSFIKMQNFKHTTTQFRTSTEGYLKYIDYVGKRMPRDKDFETTTINVP